MNISVVIPAYNEEKLLGRTLESVMSAIGEIGGAEVIVVDNRSTDATREIAAGFGLKVMSEPERNIGQVRNTGGIAAQGEVIVFLDADTVVRPGLFKEIAAAMSDERCSGGSVAVEYEVPERRGWVWYFLQLTVFIGKLLKMRQGATQFCRKDVFVELGGYDTSIYVAEDVEFHWRLDRLARRRGGHTAFIEDPKVITSTRRFEKMSLLKTIVITHPVTIFSMWRKRSVWKDWYENAVR
jgi:glycosyltransferase involved in cell wall biosynthesis